MQTEYKPKFDLIYDINRAVCDTYEYCRKNDCERCPFNGSNNCREEVIDRFRTVQGYISRPFEMYKIYTACTENGRQRLNEKRFIELLSMEYMASYYCEEIKHDEEED